MVIRVAVLAALLVVLGWTPPAVAQQAGSIRGVISDADFDAPLPFAEVLIQETGAKTVCTAEGTYVFGEVRPGTYTLIFSKEGFSRQIRSGVAVTGGAMTEVDASMSGDFMEMEEYVVQELQPGGSTELSLLRLRMESPALMDSISSDIISRAGASDAAGALRLIPGATVVDGFAVVRGLPDRYVSNQLNGIVLPTSDQDRRGVELDQFPAAAIDSIQVTKNFTPDQQGNASGGAVNLVLKGIPAQTLIQVSAQAGYNTQTTGRRDFLTYDGGGLSYWGGGKGTGNPQPVGTNWTGAVGVAADGYAPPNQKWSVSAGGRGELDDGVTVGGFSSFFYENDYEYFDNGVDDQWWVRTPGAAMTPQTKQGTPEDNDFKTALYDVTQGTELVRWGWLGTAGIEWEGQSLGVAYLYTRTATDTATLASDTRGKSYFFPGYEPNNPAAEGNSPTNRTAAPWNRLETIEYDDRISSTIILNGDHEIPIFEEFSVGDFMTFLTPRVDWNYSYATANLDQPDKRQFGSLFLPRSLNPGFPPFIPEFIEPEVQRQYKPDANFLLGNAQRIWTGLNERTNQFAVNLLMPFTQWSGDEGFLKFGVFDDSLIRNFTRSSYSNFNDNSAEYFAPWEKFWSAVFPDQNHPMSDGPPYVDVNYRGEQDILAWYAMTDLPLNSWSKIIGGARVENVSLAVQNYPEADAVWFPPGSLSPVRLRPGDADVDLDQNFVLPSIGFEVIPLENLTLRGNYAQTYALPTFKELTPILQQEYLGGDIFIGNPDLVISDVVNYDLRVDYVPYLGGLLSASYFYKDITNPIENVQRVTSFIYTTPVNYPSGTISGWEFELRQDLGFFTDVLQGFLVGGNATLIDSNVVLPADEAAEFAGPAYQVDITSRDMTDAPDYLYNLFTTIDVSSVGTQVGLFYTVTGRTLIAGATTDDGNFVPSVYQQPFGTLNLTVSQRIIGDFLKLTFQAKNLTNPAFEEVYSGPGVQGETLKTSYTLGIDLSIALTGQFTF